MKTTFNVCDEQEILKASTRLTAMTLEELATEVWVLEGSGSQEITIDEAGITGHLAIDLEDSSADALYFLANLLTARARAISNKVERVIADVHLGDMNMELTEFAEMLESDYGCGLECVDYDSDSVSVSCRKIDLELLCDTLGVAWTYTCL